MSDLDEINDAVSSLVDHFAGGDDRSDARDALVDDLTHLIAARLGLTHTPAPTGARMRVEVELADGTQLRWASAPETDATVELLHTRFGHPDTVAA